MTRIEIAIEKFDQGCDCSKAIFSAYEPVLDLDEEHRRRYLVHDSWTLGMPQKWCGIVTGACNVIAMCRADCRKDVPVEELCERFRSEFARRHSAVTCIELLGLDLSNPQEAARIVEDSGYEEACRTYMADAVEILDGLIGGS